MMHTILRDSDGIFIGMWLRLPSDQGGGDRFHRQIKVPDEMTAVQVVNALNGGRYTPSAIRKCKWL